MAHHETKGPVGPAPLPHNVVYTTLHYDTPWSYENYLKTGGYAALRKIIEGYDDDERVLLVVRGALAVVRNQKQMTLRLPPERVDGVRERVNELLAAYPGVGYLDMVADARLKGDACILESEIGLVEASIDGQIAALEGAFRKVLGSRI